jgi:Xaa-Pro aminopeptidase
MNDELGTMCVDWEQRIDFDRLRRQRVEKAQVAIAESEADLLFVFRTEDARYLTAYRHHLGPAAVIGNATVVIGADTPPILFTMDEAHCKLRMPWLGPGQVQPRANFREIAGIKEFADRVRDLVGPLSGKTIGVDMYTPAMAEGLRQAFPQSRFVDGYEILIQAKIIKTDDEIHCLKIANAMTEAAMDAALAVLKPGVRECEVLAAAWQKMTAMGSEWTQCSNIVASGPYTAPYRRFTSDRIIRLGDPVIIDIGAVFNGYYGDFTRTWICGDIGPTKEQIDLHHGRRHQRRGRRRLRRAVRAQLAGARCRGQPLGAAPFQRHLEERPPQATRGDGGQLRAVLRQTRRGRVPSGAQPGDPRGRAGDLHHLSLRRAPPAQRPPPRSLDGTGDPEGMR